MPHITEKIWQGLKGFGLGADSDAPNALIIAEYPTYKKELVYTKEAEEMKLVFDTITSLRNVRQSFNIPTSATGIWETTGEIPGLCRSR